MSLGIYRDTAEKPIKSGNKYFLCVRSYTMNGHKNGNAAGTVNAGSVVPTKITTFNRPAPSKANVVIDESSKTLEDGYFAIQVDNRVWQNDPSDRHNRGANLSFADGHSEIFKWVEPMTGKHTWNADAQKPVDRDFDRIAPTIAEKR